MALAEIVIGTTSISAKWTLIEIHKKVIATERGLAEAGSGEIEELVLRLAEEPASSE